MVRSVFGAGTADWRDTLTSRDGHYVDVDGDSYGCDADDINCCSNRSDHVADVALKWMRKMCTTPIPLLPA
jgi:hypothetical protein